MHFLMALYISDEKITRATVTGSALILEDEKSIYYSCLQFWPYVVLVPTNGRKY